MFVAEDRHAPAASPEGIGNLEEQFIAWVEMLALLVPRILAMLADQQHAMDGEPRAAKCQAFPDGRMDWHMVLAGQIAAHVVVRYLGRVHRHDFRARAWRLAVLAKAFQIFAHDDVGVGVGPVLGYDGGDAFWRRCLSARRQRSRCCREALPSSPHRSLSHYHFAYLRPTRPA